MKWFWFPNRDATMREIRWRLWGSVWTTSLLTSGRSTRIFLVEKDASSKQPARCAVCVTTTPLPLQARFPDGLLHKTFISSWLCASRFSISISLGSRSKISSLAPFVFLFYIWRKQLAVVNIKRRMSRWCVSVLQMLSLRFTVSSVKSDSSHASLQRTNKWRHTY